MVEVTIGIPLFNGAAHIGECLACVLAEKRQDLRVHVLDNASTDDGPGIVRQHARDERRLYLHNQPFNVGVLQNYLSLVMQAETPFFMWRADDDLSEPDYIATLLTALKERPQAHLAAPTVVTDRSGDAEQVRYHFPDEIWSRTSSPEDLAKRLDAIDPSWFYGLWRTEYLKRAYSALLSRYPFAFAHDPLLIAGAVMDDAVIGASDAGFIQRTDSRGRKAVAAERKSFRERIAQRDKARLPFLAAFSQMVAERQFDDSQRRELCRYAEVFASRHVGCTESQFIGWQIRKAIERIILI
jgi:glycosyltransferase involved in cell wall biosynthesis